MYNTSNLLCFGVKLGSALTDLLTSTFSFEEHVFKIKLAELGISNYTFCRKKKKRQAIKRINFYFCCKLFSWPSFLQFLTCLQLAFKKFKTQVITRIPSLIHTAIQCSIQACVVHLHEITKSATCRQAVLTRDCSIDASPTGVV